MWYIIITIILALSERTNFSVQVYGKALLPFRRSGMWTTAKVVLNISLVRDFDDIRGLFLYKIILIKTMLAFLESPEFPHGESTGIEMLKKVFFRLLFIHFCKKTLFFRLDEEFESWKNLKTKFRSLQILTLLSYTTA